ncbi:MAG: hypothetical protein SAK29_13555 [Scytonema sp. PMC 1069.18]|nr:hypothetical protein [Scytonema sp. PMC 1069.18]MEC4879779.1 hypothetical protein [Scytonema sp. PMC 1070.18]
MQEILNFQNHLLAEGQVQKVLQDAQQVLKNGRSRVESYCGSVKIGLPI